MPASTLDETRGGVAGYISSDDPRAVAQALLASIGSVFRGHDDVVVMVVAAVLSGGHVLIEDVPGSGKTTLARALARSLAGRFARIQGASDLMPADITGSGVWNPDLHAFEMVPGPLFANVVLVDELNRIPPRAQSGLLEAMEEGGVSIDGRRYDLPEPFTLIATQNPLDQHGTYPLPEGQLDRFSVGLTLGSLLPADERLVVREQLERATVDDIEPIIDPVLLVSARDKIRQVHVADGVLDYALTVVEGTRSDPRVTLGASTRAAISLTRVAQALAVLNHRGYVLPDDVKMAAVPCLVHRLVLRSGTAAHAQEIVCDALARVSVPVLP